MATDTTTFKISTAGLILSRVAQTTSINPRVKRAQTLHFERTTFRAQAVTCNAPTEIYRPVGSYTY
jgi:hypothetical protein